MHSQCYWERARNYEPTWSQKKGISPNKKGYSNQIEGLKNYLQHLQVNGKSWVVELVGQISARSRDGDIRIGQLSFIAVLTALVVDGILFPAPFCHATTALRIILLANAIFF